MPATGAGSFYANGHAAIRDMFALSAAPPSRAARGPEAD